MSENTLKRKIDEPEEGVPDSKRAALEESPVEQLEPENSPKPSSPPASDDPTEQVSENSLNNTETLKTSETHAEKEESSTETSEPVQAASIPEKTLSPSEPVVSSPRAPSPSTAPQDNPQPPHPPASPPRQSPYSRSLALGQLDSLMSTYGTSNGGTAGNVVNSVPTNPVNSIPASGPPTLSAPMTAFDAPLNQSQPLGNFGFSQAYAPVLYGTQPDYSSRPVAHQQDRDQDPTYVSLRMYCPVKEASFVIGKRGDMINHLREKSSTRINVSDNIKDVPERIVLVKGPAENAAKAFGLITRAILEEPEDEPASAMSRQYNLKLLIPHALVGYVIGKGGSKFREIEENSAAKLKAAEQPLPNSTDRVLSILGVADAIHIAVYYVSQVLLEHKDVLKKHNIIHYVPGMQNLHMMNNSMGLITNNYANTGMIGQDNMHGLPQQRSFDYQRQFQAPPPQMTAPVPAQLYTDEYGNNIVGEVITTAPVPSGTGTDKFSEDILVANVNIGSVIGKGGNNIKMIRESSGCNYVKIEPDQHQTVMLGGGRGLTGIRKLTLTGSMNLIQTAIYLINQRISGDKERNM